MCAAVTNHRFLFVCGLHRSGTSLLTRSLREHPDISGFTDTRSPEDEGQHLQSVFPTGEMLGGPGRFGFKRRGHLDETSHLVTEENRMRLFAEWGVHWNLTCPVLLEKSPPNLIRTRFLQAMFPESWFVIMTRHPAAVLLATQPWMRIDDATLIRHWLRCHEQYREDAASLKHCMEVRYEDFVADPDGALGQIYDFVGLERRGTSEIVRPDVNERYFERWEGHGTLKGRVRHLLGNWFEPRVRPFGYSFSHLRE